MSTQEDISEEALKKYLQRSPEDLEKVLQHLRNTGRLGDTGYVMNLIASVRERRVYLNDERVRKHVAPLEAELSGGSWDMSVWYPSQYNADVVLSVYRNRQKVNEGIYTCSRCLSKRTRLRTTKASGDEAIPVEIICVGCGNTWTE